ncbi:DNA-processing protein DprA [Paenibacillus cymbidii]|uniref:DNA-processing protein DprA n=1 Tax=Paenibacillus cymbidii TaxID=1639034 RepID=UPI00108203CA|nr:DNA-processing protein DprA [Paenibacillus cymbidii]
MERLDARSVLIALHEMEGVGWMTLLRVLGHLTDWATVQDQSAEQLVQLGVRADTAATIRSCLNAGWLAPKLERYRAAGVDIMTIADDDYPFLLERTTTPPWVLYLKGRRELLARPLVGVVGTRTPTVYGHKVAGDMARQFSAAGLCIVSGIARGIDSSAHRSALQEDGGTIAVLGCGIDRIYPPENASLYREVEQRGLIVSEYPYGTPPQAGLFPLRNRIIAGLCPATLVIEGSEKSGSLITARKAVEEGREVYAVPGPITSPKSKGTLQLLRDGEAMIAISAVDIISVYKRRPAVNDREDKNGPAGEKDSEIAELERMPLSPDEARIYRLLSFEPTTIDRLLEASQTNFGHLHAILLSLTLKKRIAQLPGSSYIVI